MNIKIYGTRSCGHCKYAKNYLDGKKLSYEYIDVTESGPNRDEMFKIKEIRSVPIIIINDNVLIGFHPEKIDEALGYTPVDKPLASF